MTTATVIPPHFPDHVAARIAAAWEDSRPAIPRLPIPGPRGPVDHDGDSDPHVDELLHRVRSPRSNFAICPECNGNLTPGHVCPPKAAPLTPAGLSALDGDVWDLAMAERNEQLAADVQREIAGAVA